MIIEATFLKAIKKVTKFHDDMSGLLYDSGQNNVEPKMRLEL